MDSDMAAVIDPRDRLGSGHDSSGGGQLGGSGGDRLGWVGAKLVVIDSARARRAVVTVRYDAETVACLDTPAN